MKNNGFEQQKWESFSAKNNEQKKDIDVKSVSTEDSLGLSEIILKKIKQINLEKERLDIMMDIPEEFLKPVYKKEILLDREKRLGDEMKSFYENKEIGEDERSEKVNALEKQLKEVEGGIQSMDDIINKMIAKDKSLRDKYVEYKKIRDHSEKIVDPVDPTSN